MSQQRKPCVKRERKTRFVELFRTTPTNTVCPNFYVLAHANGCAFSPQCAYCYLKSSFWHLGRNHVFTNTDRMVREIRAWIARDGLESTVLNTGNLSDSLSFESVRPLMGRLVELFREQAEAKGRPHTLLLVTKGGRRECQALLGSRPCRNVIASFSVNEPEAARQYERGAADVADRLDAAARLREAGWRVRLRIDPMILGFDYTAVARAVRDVGPERVTLGTLRAEPNLERFVADALLAPLEKSADSRGLARYPLDERLGLYRQALAGLGECCPVGLCEETPEVWRRLGLSVPDAQCNCGA